MRTELPTISITWTTMSSPSMTFSPGFLVMISKLLSSLERPDSERSSGYGSACRPQSARARRNLKPPHRARAMRHDVHVAYHELAPPPDLAHVVRCVWSRSGTGATELVLPDGCIDVVVRDGIAVVAGPDTGPVHVALAPGERVIGLRLWPGAAAAALGVPADELRDRRVALEQLWGR